MPPPSVPFPESTLVKTPRGRAEVTARSAGLRALERRILILADSKRTVAELAELLDRPLSDEAFRQALVALEQGRFVDRLEEIHSVA